MIRAHLSDWKLQLNQCFQQNNMAAEINNCAKLIESIMKHLPTVDGNIVLDVRRYKKGTGIFTKQKEDNQNLSGHVHTILTSINIYLFGTIDNNYMNLKCILDDYETTLIKGCNRILNLFPRKLDEDLFLHQDAIGLMGQFLAKALYLNKASSLTTLHGCAAAIRLWSETQSVKDIQYYMSDNFQKNVLNGIVA